MTFITTSHNKSFDYSLNNTEITGMRSNLLEYWVYSYIKIHKVLELALTAFAKNEIKLSTPLQLRGNLLCVKHIVFYYVLYCFDAAFS